MEIQITPSGMDPPFILTDDTIFLLFDSDIWSTVVRITKNCIGTINKFLRRSCCTDVINFIKAFNASIKPVLEDQGVQDLNYCNIVLENKDPTNIFYPCEASYSYDEIDMFLKCWNHKSMTASELLRQRQQPTTHEDKYEDEDYDAVRRVWDVGGRKRTRRRQKRVRSRQPPRSRSRVRQPPRRRRTK
jgi:hypothetical protein